MIYIKIDEASIDNANAWCKENVDHQGGEKTFSVNKKNDAGDRFCLISIPDNGSDYAQSMVSQFSQVDESEISVLSDIDPYE